MEKLLSRYFLILIIGFYSRTLLSQSEQVFINQDFEYRYQSLLSGKNVKSHGAIKPYVYSDFDQIGLNSDSSILYNSGFPMSKMKKEKEVHNARMSFFPLVNMGFGVANGESLKTYSDLGIGASALFEYKKVFAARINFSGHKNEFPGYLEQKVREKRITPDGYVWDTYSNGYNYTNLNGYLSWNAGKYFNLQLGRGKNFIGSGYRSLLLSDNAGNYNYGRIMASIWRLKYVVIYAHQKDINSSESKHSGQWKNKYSTTHYLSWNVAKWLNIGLFESVVWKAQDTLLNRGYDVNYLNPVLFFRPAEYSTGSSDNSLIGVNLSIKPSNKIQVYGQFILDEFLLDEFKKDVKEIGSPGSQPQFGWWANKYGGQFGFKTFDVFGLKGMGIQAEYNFSRPFTYSHADPIQNYGHQNSSLAHPLGSNFNEVIGFVNFQRKNWFAQIQVAWYNQGLSTDSVNFGENIYLPYTSREGDYGHTIAQGVQNDVINIGGRVSYLIYPRNNLRTFIGIRNRMQNLGGLKSGTMFFEFGISTSMFNRYTDI